MTSQPMIFFINEEDLVKCPTVKISLSPELQLDAILDSGSEVNILHERILSELTKSGVRVPTLPIQNFVLVTAFGRRSNKIKQQVLLEFSIGEDVFEAVFLITAQLAGAAIIGCPILREHGLTLDFSQSVIRYARDGVVRELEFKQVPGVQAGGNS